MANQQPKAQAQAAQAQSGQAPEIDQLRQLGCPDDQCQKLHTMASGGGGMRGGAQALDLSKILALVQKYGPIILPIILSLFGADPLPSPLPDLGGAGARP